MDNLINIFDKIISNNKDKINNIENFHLKIK